MKCPCCGTEMLHGYLNCGSALWSQRQHKLSLAPSSGESYALSLNRPLLWPHHIESDCCPKCKRIVIDASGYENNL